MYPRKILFILSATISFNYFSMRGGEASIADFSGLDFSYRYKESEETIERRYFNKSWANSVATNEENLGKFINEYNTNKNDQNHYVNDFDRKFYLFHAALNKGTDKAIEFVIKEQILPIGSFRYKDQLCDALEAKRGLDLKEKSYPIWRNIKGFFMDTYPINRNQYNAQIKRTMTILDCLKKYDPNFNKNMNDWDNGSSLSQDLFHKFIKKDNYIDQKINTWVINNTSNIRKALFSPYEKDTKESFLLSLVKNNFKNYTEYELTDITICLDSKMKKEIKKEVETLLLCLKHHTFTINNKEDEYILKDMGDGKDLLNIIYAPRIPLKNLKNIFLNFAINASSQEMKLAYDETNQFCANNQNLTPFGKIIKQKPLTYLKK